MDIVPIMPKRHKQAPPDELLHAPAEWRGAGEFEDIRYETAGGIAKISIDRQEVLNAFRPQTLIEVSAAMEQAREDSEVGVVVLTGAGEKAFCSGGDQTVRGDTGYVEEGASIGRFHVTDLQVQMRRLPKPVIAMVAGYAIGGGHILHVCCDMTIAADNAGLRPDRAAGRLLGRRLRRLAAARPGRDEEGEGVLAALPPVRRGGGAGDGPGQRGRPAGRPGARDGRLICREMLALSPFALRLVKASFNAHEDGYAGIQQLAHDANLLFYGSEEAAEGREAFKQKRRPEFERFPRRRMRIWLMAARPRTLPAAIAPVLVGTAAAVESGGELPRAGAFIAALIGSIFIQIGTNLANDYSDAKRGADTADRLGPVRVTSAGLVTPQRVLTATWVAFGVAVACGIYLTIVAGIVILLIGVLSIAAGVLYTGGPRPYGYAGLGEVFVFLFFGLVAVNGSYYVQVEQLDALPLGLSIAVGFLATAILVVNNVRDVETDRRAGKMTLAVRMGRRNAVGLYRLLVLGAYVVLPIALLAGETSAAAADRRCSRCRWRSPRCGR